jgi:peptidoglycan/LPS O-acetylase OafA/YrhL
MDKLTNDPILFPGDISMPSGATMLMSRLKDKQKNSKPGFRADIQGLRAFAVIAVILDHLFHWPSGGFIGVDVFFVISGFLITGHLMREWERDGQISFVGFYKGRIKRILPAAALVLLATVAASFLLLNKGRAWSVFWDGIWAALFAGNWRFAASGTDYFQNDGPVSPLQHFWSLAVEEQFYFVWPWVMLVALLIVTKSGATKAKPRVVVGSVIAGISVLSFGWALVETVSSPTVSYFSTFTRTWELGIGAFLAIATPVLLKIGTSVRPVLAWIGITGMVSSLFVINSQSLFPAPSALLPVLSTGLILAAGTGGEQRFLAPLTNPVSGYIGNISYSLYLWHFPIIIFGATLSPSDTGFAYYGLTLTGIFIASVFAYHLCEDPIRRSDWLSGQRHWLKKTKVSAKYQNTALAFLAIVAIALVVPTFLSNPVAPGVASSTGSAQAKAATNTPAQTAKLGPELAALQKEMATSLDTSKWPDLTPAIESLGTENWAASLRDVSCMSVTEWSLQDCFFATPAAPKTAVIYGDSFAAAWSPGIKVALAESGYNLQMLTLGQCPGADVIVTRDGGQAYPDCDKHHDWATEIIEDMNPDLVIIASAENTLERLASHASGNAALKEYTEGLVQSVNTIKKSSKKVVVLSSPPLGENLQECVTKISTHSSCTTSITDNWEDYKAAERGSVSATGATHVDTSLWLCTVQGVCPAFVGGNPVRVDSGHLSIEYSTRLADVIRAEVLDKL